MVCFVCNNVSQNIVLYLSVSGVLELIKHIHISIQKDLGDYILLAGCFEGVDWEGGGAFMFLHICVFRSTDFLM